MSGGLSIHVVDVSRGIVATGMRVDVFSCASPAERMLLVSGRIGSNGALDAPRLAATMMPGYYEAVFHAAEYYGASNADLPSVPFIDVITYRFGIAHPDQHYHLPMKMTPWGYSCFRGGA